MNHLLHGFPVFKNAEGHRNKCNYREYMDIHTCMKNEISDCPENAQDQCTGVKYMTHLFVMPAFVD